MNNDPLLDYLEKTFADAYRKEIDQEENVWRTLPFFVAILALQLALLPLIKDWIVALSGWQAIIGYGLLGLSGLATITAIVLIARSVTPADFRRVARETDFNEYAAAVRAQVGRKADENQTQAGAEAALLTVKSALAEQYALAVVSNRAINERRAALRGRAGLAMLFSLAAMMVFIALAVIYQVHEHSGKNASSTPPVIAKFGHPAREVERDRNAQDDRRPHGLAEDNRNTEIGGGAGEGRP